MERTLAILKPDALKRRVTGKMMQRIEEKGFRVVALKMLALSKQDAQAFYRIHAQRPFYESLTEYMSSGPVVAMVLEKENAIDALRELMGATNPEQAAEGTLRKEFGLDVEKNSIHGSDSPASAATEIPFFFNTMEVVG
ncbi:MAG: nucleoside-diphosphate kinase [Candidatus Tectomicrobia bacterium]|uniref:Nucleoside diphosphate kinase n=1 Tax=Tectimicrobiota bacterium TaxID=2528274 RepID=A0A932FVX4_UNCTE|nr:nucleoside-diphosphate kinase [Candidatus Tectomicrobia bacterium]